MGRSKSHKKKIGPSENRNARKRRNTVRRMAETADREATSERGTNE